MFAQANTRDLEEQFHHESFFIIVVVFVISVMTWAIQAPFYHPL